MTWIVGIFVFLMSMTVHEASHGAVAFIRGDRTAKDMGRLTLNPFKHIDPLGTVILPGALWILRSLGYVNFVIGWAKPVPVNFLNLRNPKRDMMWVGLAGPGMNIILAIFFYQFLRFDLSYGYYKMLEEVVFLNLVLAVFNLTPIPPLDGSRFVSSLLPKKMALAYSQVEAMGILIVIILINLGLFEKIILPLVVLLGRIIGIEF